MPEGSKGGGEVATGTGQPPGLIPQGAYLTHAGGQERRSQGGGERTDRYREPPWAMPDTCRRIAKGEEKAHLEAQNNPQKKICMYPKSHHMYSSHN